MRTLIRVLPLRQHRIKVSGVIASVAGPIGGRPRAPAKQVKAVPGVEILINKIKVGGTAKKKAAGAGKLIISTPGFIFLHFLMCMGIDFETKGETPEYRFLAQIRKH